MWTVIGLETSVDWPMEETEVMFKGHLIRLRPETHDLAPSIAVRFEAPTTYEQAAEIGTEFLSSLAWATGRYIRETMWTGGSAAINVGKSPKCGSYSREFREDHIPEIADARAKLALALYREALGNNSVAYQFLGFFKIVNILHATRTPQIDWINQTLPKLTDYRAKEKLAQLAAKTPDVGEYLFVSGRCAVAHAFSTPVVNPDDPQDRRRLSESLPVIRALAEFAIEHELGVKSTSTYYREHLFELDGFRQLLSPEVLVDLKECKPIELADLPSMPPLSIRLRDHEPYGSLDSILAQYLDASDGKLALSCQSKNGLLETRLVLDFSNERLVFEPFDWIAVKDDGSASAAEAVRDVLQFQRDYFNNGVLEVWDAGANNLMGRCRPFLPVNMRPDEPNRRFKEQIESVTSVIQQRRSQPTPSTQA